MTGEGSQAEIDRIADRLCDDYKSHAYQIGRREARSIGLKVKDASDDEDVILGELLKFYTARPVGPFGCVPRPGQQGHVHIAWVDSLLLKFRCEQKVLIKKDNEIAKQGDRWTNY